MIARKKRVQRLYKNWLVHNTIGHPAMQLLHMLGFHKAAFQIHENTLPDGHNNKGEVKP